MAHFSNVELALIALALDEEEAEKQAKKRKCEDKAVSPGQNVQVMSHLLHYITRNPTVNFTDVELAIIALALDEEEAKQQVNKRRKCVHKAVRRGQNVKVMEHLIRCVRNRTVHFTDEELAIIALALDEEEAEKQAKEKRKYIHKAVRRGQNEKGKRAVLDKNSDAGKLVLQPNETVPFTQVYIKEEQPEVDSNSIEENITYDSEEETDVLKCIKKEWEPNETSLCDGVSNFDKDGAEYTSRIKGEWESKPKDESEEVVLHEEIQIKGENASESGNEGDSYNLNDRETVSISQGSERQADETSCLNLKHSGKDLFV